MRKITRAIVHYSASDNPLHDDIRVIRTWHMDKGWNDVGYHYFINRRGQIEYGRDIQEQGAHTLDHNEDSIGICLSGKDDFTLAQYTSLRNLIEALQLTLGGLDVFGHRDFNSETPCPNFDLAQIGY